MVDRLSTILAALCQASEPVSISALAEQAGVSSRTIYSDISRLNERLSREGMACIEVKHGEASFPSSVGVNIAKVVFDGDSLYTDRLLRRKRIAEQTLMLPERFSVTDIAQHFNLSRNTIMRDFSALSSTYKLYSLSLEGEQFRGYRILGEELDARRMLIQLLQEDQLFIDQEAAEDDRAFLASACESISFFAQDLGVRLSDASARFLEFALFATWRRLSIGKHLTSNTSASGEMWTKEKDLVIRERNRLEKLLEHSLDDTELVYIAECLASASGLEPKAPLSEHWIQYGFLVQQLIEDVQDEYPLANYLEDSQLYSGLMNHLRPAYHRASMGMSIDNPLYDLAVGEYASLHAAVCTALVTLQDSLGVVFSEQEQAYFTLFFAASIERNRLIPNRPRIALVCGTGRATSEIIRARISGRFDVEVVGTFGAREIPAWLEQHRVDLVLSLVPIELPGYDVLLIGSSFTKDDEEHLALALNRLAESMRAPAVPATASRDASADGSHGGSGNQGRCKPASISLRKALPSHAISIAYDAHDKVDAVREAGRLLVEMDACSPEYVEAMVENVSSNGVYIVVAPGVAFPHAASSSGAKSVGFSIVTLKRPVAFGNSINDPVHLCIGLSMIDHQSHLKALAELVGVLNDPTAVARIMDAQTKHEILDVLFGSSGHVPS